MEFDWLDLPSQLINWLQAQNGLKINGKPIETRADLEKVFFTSSWGRRSFRFSIESIRKFEYDLI